MRLHRFYIEESIGESQKIMIRDDRLLHQWRDVFRYNVGSEVIVFDGSSFEYDCVIGKITNREAELQVVSKRRGILPERKITLYQSLVKKDNMEWIVEKATELGVSKIVPIISERSEKKGFNLERARKIVKEASEQCGRADVPEIGEVISLEEALETVENIIIFDKDGDNSSPTLFDNSIFIGPEGGWSQRELDLFKQKQAKIYSLGALILRAETAAISALTILGREH